MDQAYAMAIPCTGARTDNFCQTHAGAGEPRQQATRTPPTGHGHGFLGPSYPNQKASSGYLHGTLQEDARNTCTVRSLLGQ